MRVLVCGGRDFARGDIPEEYDFVLDTLDELSKGWPKTTDHMFKPRPDVVIITGGATGVDTAAINWAQMNYCDFEEFLPEWYKYGHAAGPIRNQKMLDVGKPDLVVAFPGGRGTADMVNRAESAGVPFVEISYG